MNPYLPTWLLVGAMSLAPGSVLAQDQGAQANGPVAGALELELNDAMAVDGGCRLTFLVENGVGGDLSALSLETAMMNIEGRVAQVTLFDFGDLSAGRPRVRQFDLSELACEDLGTVLINGVTACEGTGIEPGACQSALTLSSRVVIDLAG
ncbi:hypothetical protein [Rubellimicrobium roseum]|uniref:Tat pathway signal sequence domain protein n=1 Tax=Rubellimicrobium roseum TaxID=687525 RepID=A0A5C4NAH2_9RHOB|nr:hypothetical protein [Rubellimicrobium roseum]TNC60474.1 hypothetical protein FHG71_22025 [Rubellimicrobium roseum]